MSAEDSSRLPGFYWVARGNEDPVVAEWRVHQLAPHHPVPPCTASWQFPGESVEDMYPQDEVKVLSSRVEFPTEMPAPSGWRRVADDPPPKESWVLVWHRGTVTLGKYAPSFPMPGVHDWLLLPPGRNPFAPFPQYHPRWWRPNLDPPSDVEDHDLGPSKEVGETLVRWRWSVSDLATDLKEFLSLDEREKLCVELVYLEAGSKQQAGSSGSGSPGRTPPPCRHSRWGTSSPTQAAPRSHSGAGSREPEAGSLCS